MDSPIAWRGTRAPVEDRYRSKMDNEENNGNARKGMHGNVGQKQKQKAKPLFDIMQKSGPVKRGSL